MKLILVVDDSRFLRSATERTLKKAGYNVITAADGEEALHLAKTRSPDLVVLDMLLPKLGGPEVLKELRTDPATSVIPIIILSSLPQNNEQKLKREGAVAYFEKSQLDLTHNSQSLVQLIGEILVRK